MEKIKQFIESEEGKDILIVIIVILVGLGSFELGRLSKKPKSEGIKIEYGAETQNPNVDSIAEINSAIKTPQEFFASSKGSKYYSDNCSGGKTIKAENKIYFKTSKEAELAGFELSSTCK